MKLADLRKLALTRQARIRFQGESGLECLVDECGVARIPSLDGPTTVNLEQELASAKDFLLEPKAGKNPPRSLSREDLAAMISGAPTSPHARDED